MILLNEFAHVVRYDHNHTSSEHFPRIAYARSYHMLLHHTQFRCTTEEKYQLRKNKYYLHFKLMLKSTRAYCAFTLLLRVFFVIK